MNQEQMQDYILAAAAALDLPIAQEHMAGVMENFARLASVAAAVNGFDLKIEDEPGPVWRP